MLNKLHFTAGGGALLLLVLLATPPGTVPAASEESSMTVQPVDENIGMLSSSIDEGRKTGRISLYQAEMLHFDLGRVASLKKTLAGDDGLLSQQEMEHLQRQLSLVKSNIRLARQDMVQPGNSRPGAIREPRERRLERYPLTYRTRPNR